jgi:Spy/CpxP family protein refolding chaperone
VHPANANMYSGSEQGESGTGGEWTGGSTLRFMSHRLGLNRSQIGELARIINDLNTERAQVAVDDRRAIGVLADALAGESFDPVRAAEGTRLRASSAERLRDAVVKTLEQTHRLLDTEQRAGLAYLLRTGTLSI